MKKQIIILILVALIFCGNISAHSNHNYNALSVQSSYILPIEESDFSSSLVLGLGYEFWGIFEFVGNAYLEIDSSEDGFFESFQTPNVVSTGIGVNIPLGGFYAKGDYQRFFSFDSESSELMLSNYTDSYKYGIGMNIGNDVEIEFYQRVLFNGETYSDDEDYQSFLGLGIKFYL
ncbi:MAG: hypothetical protein OCD02_07720 [Spirochaetaceae bacterium]